uniref:Uncharacterized protein n=1 Tax=Arundo donax TaxID=35708 RepID=A0A0A9FD73_ARUDO
MWMLEIALSAECPTRRFTTVVNQYNLTVDVRFYIHNLISVITVSRRMTSKDLVVCGSL